MRRLLVAVALLLARPAVADDKLNARALKEQGIELYRAKKYEDAMAALARSYELDPQFDTLYALAQAERLGGHCPKAVVHYKQILELTTEPTLAGAVKNNMGLCVTVEDPDKPQDCSAAGGSAAGATPATSTRNTLAIALFTTSGVLAGGAIGLFVAASHSQDAAGTAATFDDYERFTERAGLARGLGYGFAATAAIGVGAAVYVLLRKPAETSPTVSASHAAGTSTVFVQARW
ncbi:MAG TPA: tetratricopeptide repeat protein [Kofleriaceae bacterium]